MSKSIPATSPVQLQVATALSTTPEAITDANGNASPLLLSTDNVTVNNGNLGVGTVPQWPLHVGIGQTVKFELTEGAMFVLGPTGVFGIDANNIAAGRFIVDDSGNVGINQPTPAFTLDVGGTIHATGQLANPGIQPASSAPDQLALQTVSVDQSTGIFYYND
jgi:hypothetical protein